MAAGKRGDRRLCLVFANSVAYTSSNVIFHLRFIGIHHAFPTVSHKKYMPMRHKLSQNLQCGGFPFNPNFRTFRFGSTGILGTSFEGEPLSPFWSFRSVGPKCPFPFDKIVVPCTALWHPVDKNNNQTLGGLVRVFATGMYRSIGQAEFPKFQTGIFVEWKATCDYTLTGAT